MAHRLDLKVRSLLLAQLVFWGWATPHTAVRSKQAGRQDGGLYLMHFGAPQPGVIPLLVPKAAVLPEDPRRVERAPSSREGLVLFGQILQCPV